MEKSLEPSNIDIVIRENAPFGRVYLKKSVPTPKGPFGGMIGVLGLGKDGEWVLNESFLKESPACDARNFLMKDPYPEILRIANECHRLSQEKIEEYSENPSTNISMTVVAHDVPPTGSTQS